VIKTMETVAALGFDVVEVSTGFIALPLRDWQRLLEDAADAGLTVRGRGRAVWLHSEGAGGRHCCTCGNPSFLSIVLPANVTPQYTLPSGC
jgi:hypothetical protein